MPGPIATASCRSWNASARPVSPTGWTRATIQGATLCSKEIVEAIRNAKVLVLFATEASFDFKNVPKEVAIASDWEKPILPVYLERVQVPDTLHYQLAGIQHVKLFAEQEEEAFNGMLGALHTIGVAVYENIEIKPLQWPRITPRSSSKTGQKQKNADLRLGYFSDNINNVIVKFY